MADTETETNVDIAELEALFLMPENEPGTSKTSDETNDENSFLWDVAKLDDSSNNIKKHKKLITQSDSTNINNKSSLIHNGDTDSSDDEEKQNCFDRKYNDYGNQVKELLTRQENELTNKNLDFKVNKDLKETNIRSSTNFTNTKHELSVAQPVKTKEVKLDVYTDPIFGMRIINPLISSSTLIERMSGKLPITLAKVKKHVETTSLDQDWVIAGCVVSKSGVKTSQKGAQYSIWLISDLRNELRTISLFLFRNAHKDLWKTPKGAVIGILNPSVLDKRENSKDEACLSVDNSQRVMLLGQSKDLGQCRSKKKNGDQCTAFVNMNICEYCIYHVKQEYVQHSKRSELQSTFAGGYGMNNLRNKVLGKSEVFYAGQSYTAIPLQKNRKQIVKDKGRLNLLDSGYKIDLKRKEIIDSLKAGNKLNASRVEVTSGQREKDLERLRILKQYLPDDIVKKHEMNKVSDIEKKIEVQTQVNVSDVKNFVPKLRNDTGIIDLGIMNPRTKLQKSIPQNRAKINALQWVKKNGPIQKLDPANLRGSTSGKKRILEELTVNKNEPEAKKLKIDDKDTPMSFKSERFKKIMEATSINEHLIVRAEDEKREKYFDALEKKEAMEEKMLGTFKLACKSVTCIKCKYTSFSASDKCKEERHPLKVLDAFKRFYKCQDCGNRTVTLDKIPKNSCKNCKSSRWIKAAMIKEKIVKTAADVLSIRGDEEMFIGSLQSGANINLLVPE